MATSKHLLRFIDMNTSGRVLLACRSIGVTDQKHIRLHTEAVHAAVCAMAEKEQPSAAEINQFLDQQIDSLLANLQKPPPPQLPKQDKANPTATETTPEKRRRARRVFEAPEVKSKSLAQKLEDSRATLKTLLNEDCVQLGLVESARAKVLSAHMAGKQQRDAEDEILNEIRGNLRSQTRSYLKKNKGGPWTSPKQQENVRLDIENRHSLSGLVSLARQLRQERQAWEKNRKKGLFRSILGG